jgi:MFS family permease
VPLYLIGGLHMSSAAAGAYATVLALGSVLSPILAGRVADRLGRRPVIVGSLWLCAVATVTLVHAGAGRLALVGPLVLLGLAAYNESPLLQALLADLARDDERDGAFSLFYVNDNLSGAVWGAVLGFVVAHRGFAAAFGVMAFSYLAASAAVLFIREGSAAPT